MDRHQHRVDRDLPFLSNEETVKYISHSKIMFIMRGLPGSGKSTIKSQIVEKYQNAVACSADDYFMSRGSYQYNPRQVQMAHEQCQTKAQVACQSGANVIVIDNTNLQLWQMKLYTDLAGKFNYVVVVVIPTTWWSFNAAELARRNKHGLTRGNIEDKLRNYQDVLPLYWGWFLNEQDSDMLVKMGKKYFSACMRKIPKFCQKMKKLYNGANDRFFLAYGDVYSRCNTSPDTIHCTAFYNGSNQVTSAGAAYHSKPDIQKSTGKVFMLHIIGIVITPDTVSARVALDQHQMFLWGTNDGDRLGTPHQSGLSGSMHDSHSLRDVTTHFQKMSLMDWPYKQFQKRPRFSPVTGPGSEAHISLGWAADCQAVKTGLDHQHVIELEMQSIDDPKFFHLHGAVARYYGNSHCVVYFDTPLHVNALFSGKY